MIQFPSNPTNGQQYVADNAVTYTYLNNRWNAVTALQQGTAEFFIDAGNSTTWPNIENYAQDVEINCGTSNNAFDFYVSQILTSITPDIGNYGYGKISWGFESAPTINVYEAGIIVSPLGQNRYDASVDWCDNNYQSIQRYPLRQSNDENSLPDCGHTIQDITGAFSGSATQSFTMQQYSDGEQLEIRAYFKSPVGIFYSDPVYHTAQAFICFVAGTEITMADGTIKPIENITYADTLRVWNFDLGEPAEAIPLWIKRPQTAPAYNLSKFSDGTELRTLQAVKGHRVFNKTAGEFTFVGLTAPGSIIVQEDGTEVTLLSTEIVNETVDFYNIFTQFHMNLYANGILTSTGFNNLYPVVDMKFAKDTRKLRDVAGIDSKWVEGLRLRENTTPVAGIARHLLLLDSLDVRSTETV